MVFDFKSVGRIYVKREGYVAIIDLYILNFSILEHPKPKMHQVTALEKDWIISRCEPRPGMHTKKSKRTRLKKISILFALEKLNSSRYKYFQYRSKNIQEINF
jgi:hypothetical protein